MEGGRVEIRPAAERDLEEARRVSAQAFHDLRAVYRPTPETALFKRQIACTLKRLVAVHDGRIVGTVEYQREAESLHVLGLAVHPDHRRRGVARRLVEALKQQARDHALRRLTLDTVKETGNVEIFRKLGFRTVKEGPADQFESDRHEHLTNVFMEQTVT